MSLNYQQLSEQIKTISNPENLELKKSTIQELSAISYSQVLTFVKLAMAGVEPSYTNRTREAGEKVKSHLKEGLENVSYRYQGSVMTNTHIMGYSDIDLLVISEKFYQWDVFEVNSILNSSSRKRDFYEDSIRKLEKEMEAQNYSGNSLQDLRDLRMDSEWILSSKYAACDKTKPKSIRVTNKTLNREVDIVISNWYDDVKSIINNKRDFRGVQVYNKIENSRGNPSYPFLSIERINERSSITNGRLKKMIRFLKHIKARLEFSNLTSFDINAICYDIDIAKYQSLAYYHLVKIIHDQIEQLCVSPIYANRLTSVDERELIFNGKPDKLNSLKELLYQVKLVLIDLNNAPIYG